MIPLEIIFGMLDELRAEVIAMVENPGDKSEFGFGDVAGRLRAFAEFRSRLNDLVEQNQRGSDDQ